MSIRKVRHFLESFIGEAKWEVGGSERSHLHVGFARCLPCLCSGELSRDGTKLQASVEDACFRLVTEAEPQGAGGGSGNSNGTQEQGRARRRERERHGSSRWVHAS